MLRPRFVEEPSWVVRRVDNDEDIAGESTEEDAEAICEIFHRYLQERCKITFGKPRGRKPGSRSPDLLQSSASTSRSPRKP
jgi:hypothetical protein